MCAFASHREMEMASSHTPTAVGAPSDWDVAVLGGIEALDLKVGPVRRNLFGPVDHRQLQQDFQRLLSMGVEVGSCRSQNIVARCYSR